MNKNKTKFLGISLSLIGALSLSLFISQNFLKETTVKATTLEKENLINYELNDNVQKLITVVGEGEIEAIPDVAYVNIGVISENKDLSKAQDDNNTKMNSILKKLKDSGVKESNIKTTNYSVYPNYKWDDKEGTSKMVGYTINNVIRITVENIDKTSNLLDEVIKCGSNYVNGIDFGVKDTSKLYDKALALAVNNAKSKASSIVNAIDATNLETVKITELSDISYGYYEAYDSNSVSLKYGSGPSINQGTISISAKVSIDFKFETKQITTKNVSTNKVNLSDMVEYSLDKTTYLKNDKLKLTIKNLNKENNLTFGRLFTLEKFNGEYYEEVPIELMFTMDLVVVTPNKDFVQEVDLSKLNLSAGDYRIIKNVSFDNNTKNNDLPLNITLQKNFKVK